jgi:hypothetical protein
LGEIAPVTSIHRACVTLTAEDLVFTGQENLLIHKVRVFNYPLGQDGQLLTGEVHLQGKVIASNPSDLDAGASEDDWKCFVTKSTKEERTPHLNGNKATFS